MREVKDIKELEDGMVVAIGLIKSIDKPLDFPFLLLDPKFRSVGKVYHTKEGWHLHDTKKNLGILIGISELLEPVYVEDKIETIKVTK